MRRRCGPRALLVVTLAAAFAGSPGFRHGPAVAAVAERAGGCSVVVDRNAGPPAPEVGRFATIQDAIDWAVPGDVICVLSTGHGDERVTVRTSGTAEAPIRIRAAAGGAVSTAGFVVRADDVTVEGFEVRNAGLGYDHGRGYGIYVAGAGVEVVGNTVIDSEYDGIGCEIRPPSCVDVRIAGNVVGGANGSGITAAGRGLLVEGNEVYGSVMRGDRGDADGIRFFGSNLTLRNNHVHDISAAGYPSGREPHTDCFQTFDNGKPPTTDVLIEGNTCVDVDVHCLIATAVTRGQSARIVFRDNVCRVAGAQAVLVRSVPAVSILDNEFTGPIEYRAVILLDGSTDATLRGNAFVGPFRRYEVDSSSQPGLTVDDRDAAGLPRPATAAGRSAESSGSRASSSRRRRALPRRRSAARDVEPRGKGV